MALGAAGAHARCSISLQDVVFGSYDPSSMAPTGTIAEFTVSCSSPAALTLHLSPSRGSGSTSNRRLRHRSRADQLAYNLFLDAAYTRLWGDGAQGAPLELRVERQATGRIYGQIPSGQQVWVGDYEDTVTLTVLP